MAYYTGQVNSFLALKDVIENAAVTAAGWQLNSGILSKKAAYVQLLSGTYQGYERLQITGGTGQSGESLLGAALWNGQIAAAAGHPIVWPAYYHIHVLDGLDEVYCVLNHGVDFFQLLAFGISDIPGIGGTGGWFSGSMSSRVGLSGALTLSLGVSADSVVAQTNIAQIAALWAVNSPNPNAQVHCSLDNGAGWLQSGQASGYSSIPGALITSLPSPLNQAHVLIPVKCVAVRPSGGRTIVVQHHGLRALRLDNVEPGDIVSLGGERWKCYPWAVKDSGNRNGISGYPSRLSSGTFGWAIRYDGP